MLLSIKTHWVLKTVKMWILSVPFYNYENLQLHKVVPTMFLLESTAAAAAAKSLQSCLTLCDPIDGSPPGFPVPGILQARTLQRVAISFSNAWKWKGKVKLLSRVWPSATPWTAAHQAPPSMGFSRQEYWSGCHCLLHWKALLSTNLGIKSLYPTLSSVV